MELSIDGIKVTARQDQTLRQIVGAMGMDCPVLSQRPIAAKIAGEVFSLNYVPVRGKDAAAADRPSIRAAMAASGGVVQLLRVTDPSGWEVYERTARFVMFLAMHQLWPKAKAKLSCALGPAQFVQVTGAEDFDAAALKARIKALVEQDIPLLRTRISTQEAVELFRGKGDLDKAQLLKWRSVPHFDVYSHGQHRDYHYGELAPSTGYLQVWDVLECDGGFLFVFPDRLCPDSVGTYRDMPNFFAVFSEGERWCELMECQTIHDLNQLVRSGRIRGLIRVNEALHEKRYGQIADMVSRRGCRIVMLAGPSSSGKTTSANRLAVQLRLLGKKPVLMSLDDYYIDRDKIAPGPDGTLDLEHINTIDTALFAAHLRALLGGSEVEIPSFDFKTGRRRWTGHKLRLQMQTVVIVEGLHALNPVLLPEGIRREQVFRLYISPLLPLNMDDHNRIPTSYLRLLRRTVRDYETRGSSVQQTLAMWDSVRRGEARWIFPYQENADVIFNSSTLYELAVLKKHIYPLLAAIKPEEACYEQVRALVKILNYVLEADVDDEIPPTSLVREFIGGNAFYR